MVALKAAVRAAWRDETTVALMVGYLERHLVAMLVDMLVVPMVALKVVQTEYSMVA